MKILYHKKIIFSRKNENDKTTKTYFYENYPD